MALNAGAVLNKDRVSDDIKTDKIVCLKFLFPRYYLSPSSKWRVKEKGRKGLLVGKTF